MTNDDFRQKFEQHRKEIAVTDDTDAADKPMTRAELFGRKEPSAKKKKKAGKAVGKKSRSKGSALINTLLILFMLIPLSLFIYVYKFYDPMESSNAAELEQNLEIDTSIAGEDAEPPAEGGAVSDAEEQEAEEQAEKQQEEQNRLEEQQKREEQKKLEEQQKREEQKKLEEQKRLEEQQRIEEQKRKEEQARIAEQKKREEQQRQEKEKEQAKRGSHTVQPGETLYRISVNFYGSGDGVEKIKRANGLSSNEISVGQTLIIP